MHIRINTPVNDQPAPSAPRTSRPRPRVPKSVLAAENHRKRARRVRVRVSARRKQKPRCGAQQREHLIDKPRENGVHKREEHVYPHARPPRREDRVRGREHCRVRRWRGTREREQAYMVNGLARNVCQRDERVRFGDVLAHALSLRGAHERDHGRHRLGVKHGFVLGRDRVLLLVLRS
jgi:hypothetical protein